MKLALDTNRYIDFVRGIAEVVRRVNEAEAVCVPFATLAEIRLGFEHGHHARDNERVLAEFLQRPGVSCLFPDQQTTRHYAAIYGELRRKGTPIPTNDVWIAALVVQHGLTLYARDKHFDHLPQLPRL